MATKHMRNNVVYQRTSLDIPVDIKADVDKYEINIARTCVIALKKAIEERKRIK
jgi:hypothetical protein